MYHQGCALTRELLQDQLGPWRNISLRSKESCLKGQENAEDVSW